MRKPGRTSVMAILSVGTVLLASTCVSFAGGFQTQPLNAPRAAPAGGGFAAQAPAATAFASAVPSISITRSDYVIGPEDVIQVDVFDVPDLSRTVAVDSSGQVLLPLLGQITAANESVAQLTTQIQSAYADTYVRDPKVTVTVKESASLKVTVDGAVVDPGIYPISTNTTLMKAIAMAKGPDMKLADVNKVAIFRTVGPQRTEAIFDLEDIRDGKSIDPQIMANDVIVVDTSAIRRFLQDISPIAPFAALGGVL
jgi:polysaccharide export outer membrane protein